MPRGKDHGWELLCNNSGGSRPTSWLMQCNAVLCLHVLVTMFWPVPCLWLHVEQSSIRWCCFVAEGAKEEPQVVVNVVATPKALEDFPGLYVGALPELPFICEPALCSICSKSATYIQTSRDCRQLPSLVLPCRNSHILMQYCGLSSFALVR